MGLREVVWVNFEAGCLANHCISWVLFIAAWPGIWHEWLDGTSGEAKAVVARPVSCLRIGCFVCCCLCLEPRRSLVHDSTGLLPAPALDMTLRLDNASALPTCPRHQ